MQKTLAFFPFLWYDYIISYPKINRYRETGLISLKKDIYYRKTAWEPMTDVPVPRCPDIVSFHFSLDRIFGDQYEFSGETHPFHELVYVLSGSIGVTEPHVLNLSFHASAMPEYAGRILAPDLRLQEQFLEISMEVRDGLHRSDAALLNEQRLRLEHWLLQVMRNASEAGVTESSGALRYAEIVSVLREHLTEQLSAGEIAVLCRMSLSNLKKIFTKYAGMGVSRYFTEMKMRRAAELLRSGKRVGEVANELGFADQNYFSTVFRRIMGVPPGQYRL